MAARTGAFAQRSPRPVGQEVSPMTPVDSREAFVLQRGAACVDPLGRMSDLCQRNYRKLLKTM